MMATDHAYCAASRPLLAISCLLAAFHGLRRTPQEAAFVATLTANLCDLAALSPQEAKVEEAVGSALVGQRAAAGPAAPDDRALPHLPACRPDRQAPHRGAEYDCAKRVRAHHV